MAKAGVGSVELSSVADRTGVRAAVFELDVLYDLKLGWDDVVLEGGLFAYPSETMATGALLRFFR